MFTAKMTGTCSKCGQRILPGQSIESTPRRYNSGYGHTVCPQTEPVRSNTDDWEAFEARAQREEADACRDHIYPLNNNGTPCPARVYKDGLCEDHYWGNAVAQAEVEQERAAYADEYAREAREADERYARAKATLKPELRAAWAKFEEDHEYFDGESELAMGYLAGWLKNGGAEEVAEREAQVCDRCAGTGQFITRIENGVPKGPGGNCFRCAGKGYQNDADRRRNWGYDNYGQRVS